MLTEYLLARIPKDAAQPACPIEGACVDHEVMKHSRTVNPAAIAGTYAGEADGQLFQKRGRLKSILQSDTHILLISVMLRSMRDGVATAGVAARSRSSNPGKTRSVLTLIEVLQPGEDSERTHSHAAYLDGAGPTIEEAVAGMRRTLDQLRARPRFGRGATHEDPGLAR